MVLTKKSESLKDIFSVLISNFFFTVGSFVFGRDIDFPLIIDSVDFFLYFFEPKYIKNVFFSWIVKNT